MTASIAPGVASEQAAKSMGLAPGAWARVEKPELDEEKDFFDGGNGDSIDGMEARISKIEIRLDGVESQLSEIKQEIKGLRWWILGTFVGVVTIIFAVTIPLILHESNRNWEVAQKALERGNEANIKAEALRLATEWQRQAAPSPTPSSK